ncbi:glycerol dehydratase reactivase beta/small subunit family protein [Patulibacter sp. SYSU D01012]|uniref:glycerol dehydratase reactivase beta/small subunit family protein n=1 Tax=Patulibacter sp. SYSU D01012 TaxID=2817381 RepID=UPI001B3113CB
MSDLRRGPRRDEARRRSVLVARLSGAGDRALRDVLAGLEEEGVPADVEPAEGPLAACAHAAAGRAALRVGVALGPAEACVHAVALPADAPLLHRRDPDADALRRLGQDAARLVKTVPLTLSPDDRSPR